MSSERVIFTNEHTDVTLEEGSAACLIRVTMAAARSPYHPIDIVVLEGLTRADIHKLCVDLEAAADVLLGPIEEDAPRMKPDASAES
jgi:molybdopterin-guanine dinucleotide biosynthesis protein